jgi:hypothetical protein
VFGAGLGRDWNIDWRCTGQQTSLDRTVMLPSGGLNLHFKQSDTAVGFFQSKIVKVYIKTSTFNFVYEVKKDL